ncbi:LANO_0A04522g1_1 [Lachancea nothofagi CBS 11611]|uniref:tRNA-5-taurinomethyluridine 2-sulfurtransferase n=1 Tax=Lachancea nothofagi CBS 11611 TaxID=1266666 RepID=A0A1G4IQD2_9SACH|nr:LANO_0A04522g1_1 [Lachancea nothofagi CBS 11611]
MGSLKCLAQVVKLSGLEARRIPGYGPMMMPGKFDNVVVAMSSGVDSSVAAAMFADFPKVQGIYMQNWSDSEAAASAGKEPCHERDWNDVQRVGKHLGLPVDRVNFEQDYWQDVFEPMLQAFQRGITPNPDIGCNRFIKFGRLRAHLDSKLGHNNYWLVTGHYAQVRNFLDSGEPHLLRSYYKSKDQSYYLSQVPQSALANLCLPMGALTKPEVREMAHQVQLPTASKPDSQGICFVANSQHTKFKNFLQQYLPSEEGAIVSMEPGTHGDDMRVWGRHTGLWNYTIGQKVGISMPQGDPRYSGAWFVAQKIKDSNTIVICRGRDNLVLYKNKVVVHGFEALGDSKDVYKVMKENVDRKEIYIQYRSLQDPVRCLKVSIENDQITMVLDKAQRAMAPGQYCTIYHKERILGSGIIKSSTSDGGEKVSS